MNGSVKPPEVFDTLYVFLCTAYLVTPLDLVTVFWQTKCVTKSRVHCTSKFVAIGRSLHGLEIKICAGLGRLESSELMIF